MNKQDLENWWWGNKDKITSYSVIFYGIAVWVGLYFLLTIEKPIKNETHCSQLVYYNKSNGKIDTAYSPVVVYGDSIVNITIPNGSTYWAKDFLTQEDTEIDGISGHDITLSNGLRYKIITLDSGVCQSKIIMDSIRNTYNEDTYNY